VLMAAISPLPARRPAVVFDRYASPEMLARVSHSPLVVCELIWQVTDGDREHLTLLRERRGDAETWRERYAIIWVARAFTRSSFPQIGRALASDHSSVIRGYNQAKLLMLSSHEFRGMAERLIRTLPKRHRVQKKARVILEGVGR
jgi:hypothetical protein